MLRTVCFVLIGLTAMPAAELSTKKSLNLSAIKLMVNAAEAEAAKRNVQVSLCIVDESGNLLFFEKADAAALNTIEFAQRKAKHAAFYGSPSRNGAEALKKGDLAVLDYPQYFSNQAGCLSKWTAKRLERSPQVAQNRRSTRPSRKLASTLY